MLHNPIITWICALITCICPLIQDVANISMSSYSIVNLSWKNCTVLHRALLQDVTHSPLPDTEHHVLSHSLPGVGLFEPHLCPHIHDPLRATVTPVLWILFCLRILSLTLRLRLGQCPVRDGWVHWVSGLLDNTQLLWESRKIIRCVVLFECRHWLLFVYEIEKTLDKREISHKAFRCSLIQFSTYICPWRI